MTMVETFRQRLADGDVIVVDGGMGTELTRRGAKITQQAWAAPVVLEQADLVRATHEDYIAAGADVIITNTYMANQTALQHAGFGDRFADINRLSAIAALEARDKANRPVLVAGSIFPGHIGDDWEFVTPQKGDDVERLTADVREHASVLIDAGVDLLVFEMPPNDFWLRLAVDAVAEMGVPVWLSLSYLEIDTPEWGTIHYPTDPPGQVGELARRVIDGTKADLFAVGIMHTALKDMDHALDDLATAWHGPLSAYPHHVEPIAEPPGLRALHISPEDYVEHARRWVERGAQLVGGCCAIGPEHIRALKEHLPTKGSP
jgi:S-methylmethionine-dependent homocysteine/selenocysteine methylase